MVDFLRRLHQGLTFSAVGLLLHEVVPGPEGDQVGVVGGRGDGDGPRAPDVGVAQLVSQLLQLVSLEPKHYASLSSRDKNLNVIISRVMEERKKGLAVGLIHTSSDLLSSQRTW